MKKLSFCAMLAASIMMVSSCQEDLSNDLREGQEALVSFNVGTPLIATRAYSDGTTATVLKYAVYDASGAIIDHFTEENGTINLQTSVNFKLKTGNTYSVLFWAEAENAPYDVDLAAKKLTVDYANATSNAENRDAFYKFETFKVEGPINKTIELRRPFAQLNIGTDDLTHSANAGYKVTETQVFVPVYTELDLTNGAVSNQQGRTFAFAALPQGEEFPVDGYEYMAMNYLLVSPEKEVVEIEFTYTDGTTPMTRTIGAVPVQRNYRTNIYGTLLTSDANINVEIVPDYDQPDENYPDSFSDQLRLASAFGGVVKLTENVELNSTLEVRAGMVIDLNGFNLTYNGTADVMARVYEGGLTFEGEGIVETAASYVALAYEGATITVNGDASFKAGSCTVFQANGGKIYLNGGFYEVADTQWGTTFMLNHYDSLKDVGLIEVKGGSFKGFNPADNKADGQGTSYLADGYSVIEEGDWFTVVEGTTVVAQSLDEFEAALSNEGVGVLNLDADLNNGSDVFALNQDMIFYMNGNEIIAGGQGTNNYAFNVFGSEVTVNDANLNGAGFAVLDGSNVTVNNSTIAAHPGKSGRNMFYIVGNSTVTVNEGTYTFDRTSCYFVYVEAGSTCYINGGHFEKPLANNASKDSFVNNASAGTVIITGGTFNVDPTKWVADGYEAVKSGKIWTVQAK